MKYDIIVVGAGIVGLATSLEILNSNPSIKLLILEKESDIAKHQTGNNSGVIHSGIYYKPGSLKARNCRIGYEKLIDFCTKEGIEYEMCGKVIVATNEKELPVLNMIYERGLQNGLEKIKKINSEEIKEYEPNVKGVQGIYVPYTGITDFKKVAAKYLENILRKGGEVRFNEKVIGIKKENSPIVVNTSFSSFYTKLLITCAGLYSDRVARLTHPDLKLRIIPFRGEYYKLKKEKNHLIKNLIYPVPNPQFPFLGVHFTRMINGEVEAGPNAVLAFKREGYKKSDFNLYDLLETIRWKGFVKVMAKYWKMGLQEFYRSYSKKAFVKALQQLLPEIEENDLIPGGAGVRAQACDDKGNLLDDFYILEDKNIIHVCNAPSPAATASLAIGEYISRKALEHLT